MPFFDSIRVSHEYPMCMCTAGFCLLSSQPFTESGRHDTCQVLWLIYQLYLNNMVLIDNTVQGVFLSSILLPWILHGFTCVRVMLA